ncbi:hypothetical protein ACFSMW_18680 [Virgibacillus halophilus]|uniref:Uncharacterized protein n=1 Tax=Tigheibacillus halophilus TaxID=361280 RepID=A0ABU5C1R9_9BACI|nr:hypothetical protein [Virgibacillus halophilus]
MKKIGYYAAGHTGKGFVNYLHTNCEGLKKIYVLKHPSYQVKTGILQRLISHFEQNNDVEVLYSSYGVKYLDGCIVRGRSIAFIDDTIADRLENVEMIEIGHPNATDYASNEQIGLHLQAAYDYFSRGLKIHDKLEDIFVHEMNFDKADEVATTFIERILQNAVRQGKNSYTYHRLFGTNTPDGAVNKVRELLNDLQYSCFIKGRAGTGKSTFMKKVLAACKEYGYDVELYHCSFDPESVDMVLVRDLNFCIFDSTDPHELYPQLAGEEIIDMYKETVAPGTDEKYEKEIAAVNGEYKSYMKRGLQELEKAGKWVTRIDERYLLSETEYEKLFDGIISQAEKS